VRGLTLVVLRKERKTFKAGETEKKRGGGRKVQNEWASQANFGYFTQLRVQRDESTTERHWEKRKKRPLKGTSSLQKMRRGGKLV